MSMSGSRHPIANWGKSRTRQQDADYADINKIMAKYIKTGVLPVATRQGFFDDVSTVGDYREAIERVEHAEKWFMALPPKIRFKFENDPAQFLDFVSNPENMSEIEEMGLIESEQIAPAKPVEAVPKKNSETAEPTPKAASSESNQDG